MRRLENKIAIITGGGRGIGKAITHRYLDEGATVIIAELSAWNTACCLRPLSVSHICSPGSSAVLTPWQAATISASGVECDTAVCPFDCELMVNLVFGPCIVMCIPVVLLSVLLQPAKSASVYKCSWTSSFWSPTHPMNRLFTECLT